MRFLDADTFYRKTFGCKMYKASVSLDVTCPTRDGTKGTGGCRFCSPMGSGDFAASCKKSISSQIDEAIDRLSSKTGKDTGFIAYFQSFTSTYCDPSLLDRALEEAAAHPRVRAIAIGTRPDCLPEDIMDVLKRHASRIPVTVELGLQTSKEKTAEWFGRAFRNDVYQDAVRKLHEAGIEVTTHIIFGLKGECVDDMVGSVRFAVESGTDSLKFTCLYFLRGTPLEEDLKNGELASLSMEEYFGIVEEALREVPPGMPVLRITGDGPKGLLIAPLWTADKRKVINYIRKRFG